jgi:hypothetical protein
VRLVSLVIVLMLIESDTVILSEKGTNTYKLAPKEANVIRAWKIIIQGEVLAPGQDVTLVAHEIEFEGGSVLDTSGADGQGSKAGSKPTLSINPGQKGSDGADGTAGQDGGNVTIVCELLTGLIKIRTEGGRGGRGQDGGDGARGADAPIPPDIHFQGLSVPVLAPGTPGSPGGKGGKAGSHGRNAKGGQINIITGNHIDTANLALDTSGGSDLEVAVPGEPGGGGQGAPGPKYIAHYVVLNEDEGGGMYHPPPGTGWIPDETFPSEYMRWHRIFPGTPKGPSPKGPPADPTPEPQAGSDGLISTESLTDPALAKNCSVQQLRETLLVAERYYINNQPEQAVSRLIWVAKIGTMMAA